MSYDQTVIAMAKPQIIVNKLESILENEICKGCLPDIYPKPVMLEPFYTPPAKFIEKHTSQCVESPDTDFKVVRLQAWISPEQKFRWNDSELFLKQLQTVSHRIGFEISGNNKGIVINFLCHPSDLPILKTAFEGVFNSCEITALETTFLSNAIDRYKGNMVFREFFSPPPYHHLLTRPAELETSPFQTLLTAMNHIEKTGIGIYQALFQPVSPEHNWHLNVQKLLDAEYHLKLQGGYNSPQRYAQQGPSGNLNQMASEVENKAHNDKPFYSIMLRVAVISADQNKEALLKSLAAFTSLFQYGGRPLQYITEQEYKRVISHEQLCNMFVLAQSYRPGFLVNSFELSSPVHIPGINIGEDRDIPIKGRLNNLRVRNPALLSGTCIGLCNYAGKEQKVCIHDKVTNQHSHLIGPSGVGKTTVYEHKILNDIKKGHGVAVLDPHGDLIERIISFLPERYINKIIYFDPGNPEWVPLWNPLQQSNNQKDIGRATDEIVKTIKSFVSGTGWGDRLEHLLRNLIFSLMHIPNISFLDIYMLLQNDPNIKENSMLVKEITEVLDNKVITNFWDNDYTKYKKDDLGPPKNKLSKLLVNHTVSFMLSQPESRFNFQTIMDNGMIFLADFSTVGTMLKEVLGSFILSHFYMEALSRSNIPEDKRRPFHIYADEAYHFVTDSIQDMLVETRKYNVSLNLAHQHMKQFTSEQVDALAGVGTTIIFRVGKTDAQTLSNNLQGKVETKDLVSLKNFEAIARIGTDIVHLRTQAPIKIPAVNFRNRIIDESRRKYCMPVHEVKKLIHKRNDRWSKSYSPLVPHSPKNSSGAIQEFIYDEF